MTVKSHLSVSSCKDAASAMLSFSLPASRGLSRRGKMKREERELERLTASDELFDETADQISGRKLPVFKTSFI